MTTRLYFLAGEASGDAHGAAVIAALRERRPDLAICGRGGSQMRALAGGEIEDWCDQSAVVGLWEVLKKYRYFRGQFQRVLEDIERLAPAAVVLIDYPGFNLRLAAALRKRGLPLRIIYYISPQVWAWNRGRIPRLARLLDLMICIFPFEPPMYGQAGLKSIFAGHPLVDATAAEAGDPPAREPDLVGLFPGSRQREVRKNFPVMLAAAQRLRALRPGLRFAAAAVSESRAAELRAARDEAGWSEADCPVSAGASRRLMRRAAVGLVASGTATVEAACLAMPLLIIYRVAWLTYGVGRAVVRVPYLGMINLLAGREIAREFLQSRARPGAIADDALRLLENAAARERQLADLREVVGKLGGGGAGGRAAEAILAELP